MNQIWIEEHIRKIEKSMAELYFEQKRLKKIVEGLKQKKEQEEI